MRRSSRGGGGCLGYLLIPVVLLAVIQYEIYGPLPAEEIAANKARSEAAAIESRISASEAHAARFAKKIAPTPTVPVLVPSPTPATDCDPSYPTICISPSSPELNCPDVSARNFIVLQPDRHRFDREKDGIGCETRE